MVRAIAAGWDHMCALTAAGGVQCWGDNWIGQLGDGAKESVRNEPAPVIGLDSGVQAITAGRGHTCALTAAGGVQCWGDNKGGQLGNGTQTDSPQPVAVVGLDTGVRAVAAGLGLTCALTDGGGVKCWGATLVGDGTRDLRSTPVDVVGLGSGVQAITAGDWHVCALTEQGAVKCWGDNQKGQLGDGSTEERLLPVAVTGLQNGVQQIDAGRYATCALMISGEVRCWGWLQSSFDIFDDFQMQPVPVGGLNGGVQAVATGGGHVCALAAQAAAPGSSIQCWGFNLNGQLGVNPGWAPVDVVALLPRSLFAPVVWQ
jgi:alpha-tubulin suppressor-like RCC1 family protein